MLREEGANNLVVELVNMEHEDGEAAFKVRALKGEAPASFGPSSLFVDSKGFGFLEQ